MTKKIPPLRMVSKSVTKIARLAPRIAKDALYDFGDAGHDRPHYLQASGTKKRWRDKGKLATTIKRAVRHAELIGDADLIGAIDNLRRCAQIIVAHLQEKEFPNEWSPDDWVGWDYVAQIPGYVVRARAAILAFKARSA